MVAVRIAVGITQDAGVERFLDFHSGDISSWEFKSVKLSAVHIPQGAGSQQVRSKTIMPHNFERIKIAIDNDLVTKPVILREGIGGRLEVIDGNHRVKAYKSLGYSEIDAYVVQCANISFLKLRYAANIGNGESLGAGEIEDGVRYLLSQSYTQKQIGIAMGVASSVVSEINRSDQGAKALLKAGVAVTTPYRSVLSKLPTFEVGHLAIIGKNIQHLTGDRIASIASAYRRVLSDSKEAWCEDLNKSLEDELHGTKKDAVPPGRIRVIKLMRKLRSKFSGYEYLDYVNNGELTEVAASAANRISELSDIIEYARKRIDATSNAR